MTVAPLARAMSRVASWEPVSATTIESRHRSPATESSAAPMPLSSFLTIMATVTEALTDELYPGRLAVTLIRSETLTVPVAPLPFSSTTKKTCRSMGLFVVPLVAAELKEAA